MRVRFCGGLGLRDRRTGIGALGLEEGSARASQLSQRALHNTTSLTLSLLCESTALDYTHNRNPPAPRSAPGTEGMEMDERCWEDQICRYMEWAVEYGKWIAKRCSLLCLITAADVLRTFVLAWVIDSYSDRQSTLRWRLTTRIRERLSSDGSVRRCIKCKLAIALGCKPCTYSLTGLDKRTGTGIGQAGMENSIRFN